MKKQQSSLLRVVEADIDSAFESAKVSFSSPIPVLQIVQAADVVALPAPAPAPAVIPTLPATSGVPTTDTQPGKSIAGRALAAMLILGTLGALSWLGVQIYYVVTDGWVAPLHLSPDSDQVMALKMAHQKHMDELTRIDAEVQRLDADTSAVEAAIAKLSSLRGNSAAMLKWQAETSRVEVGGLSQSTDYMKRQLALLEQLHTREVGLVARAKADLAAGLVDRTAVDREEQARDQLALEMTDLQRQIGEARVKRKQSASALAALSTRSSSDTGTMPEVAAGDERDIRVEVEIQRLEAELRGNNALRAAAIAAAQNERALDAEVESRPLRRAMKAATDVAFIPYTQLASVKAGASVIDCTWAIFACKTVGHVGEVLPGEVVTQDPWGEMARGQYAVLQLDDPDAVQNRVLRVRP